MKRYLKIFLILLLAISCSTTNDIAIEEPVTSKPESTETTLSSTIPATNDDETITKYQFDIEKMSPLTGKYITQEEWLIRPRRVISFKVDNNIIARPQSGIEHSDLIFEVLVEGGMTRFLVLFLDSKSDYLGPIRSARPTDPTLIKHFGSTLVVSGATAGLIPAIREIGVQVIEEQRSPSMFRISTRKAPHNLYADTELIRGIIDQKGYLFIQPGPNPLFQFGYDQTNWIAKASKISIKYSEETTVIWKLDSNLYNRFMQDSYSNSDSPEAHNWISQDNFTTDILTSETIIVIQGVQYRDEATTLPSILTVGLGPVSIFNNGNMIQGTWRRSDIDDPFDLFDQKGDPIMLPPSKMWIHIMSLDGIVTTTE